MTNQNSIEPDKRALEKMALQDQSEPIVMLNMLRYRETAARGFGVDGLSGEAAYRVYGEKFAAIGPRFGSEPVWMGKAGTSIIGDENWDVVILVRYSSRKNFVALMRDPDYQAIATIRAAALEDSRLIEMNQLLPRLP